MKTITLIVFISGIILSSCTPPPPTTPTNAPVQPTSVGVITQVLPTPVEPVLPPTLTPQSPGTNQDPTPEVDLYMAIDESKSMQCLKPTDQQSLPYEIAAFYVSLRNQFEKGLLKHESDKGNKYIAYLNSDESQNFIPINTPNQILNDSNHPLQQVREIVPAVIKKFSNLPEHASNLLLITDGDLRAKNIDQNEIAPDEKAKVYDRMSQVFNELDSLDSQKQVFTVILCWSSLSPLLQFFWTGIDKEFPNVHIAGIPTNEINDNLSSNIQAFNDSILQYLSVNQPGYSNWKIIQSGDEGKSNISFPTNGMFQFVWYSLSIDPVGEKDPVIHLKVDTKDIASLGTSFIPYNNNCQQHQATIELSSTINSTLIWWDVIPIQLELQLPENLPLTNESNTTNSGGIQFSYEIRSIPQTNISSDAWKKVGHCVEVRSENGNISLSVSLDTSGENTNVRGNIKISSFINNTQWVFQLYKKVNDSNGHPCPDENCKLGSPQSIHVTNEYIPVITSIAKINPTDDVTNNYITPTAEINPIDKNYYVFEISFNFLKKSGLTPRIKFLDESCSLYGLYYEPNSKNTDVIIIVNDEKITIKIKKEDPTPTPNQDIQDCVKIKLYWAENNEVIPLTLPWN